MHIYFFSHTWCVVWKLWLWPQITQVSSTLVVSEVSDSSWLTNKMSIPIYSLNSLTGLSVLDGEWEEEWSVNIKSILTYKGKDMVIRPQQLGISEIFLNFMHSKNFFEPTVHYLYVVSALDLNLLKKKPLKWLKIFKRYSCWTCALTTGSLLWFISLDYRSVMY